MDSHQDTSPASEPLVRQKRSFSFTGRRLLYGYYVVVGLILTSTLFLPWITLDTLGCRFAQYSSNAPCGVVSFQVAPHTGNYSLLELSLTPIDLQRIGIQGAGYSFDIWLLQNNPQHWAADGNSRIVNLDRSTNHVLDLRLLAWAALLTSLSLIVFPLVLLLQRRTLPWDLLGMLGLLLGFLVITGLGLFYVLQDPLNGVSEATATYKYRTFMMVPKGDGYTIAIVAGLVFFLLGFIGEYVVEGRESNPKR